jgi:hypothetical protein
MKSFMLLQLAVALLLVSCSFPSIPPPAAIPVTGSTVSPLSPTLTSQPATPEIPSLTPFHGSALTFDGQDDYVMVEDDPLLDLQNSFTIAAWIYLENYTEWASLVTKGDKPNINNYAIHQSGPYDPIYKTEFGRLRFSGCIGLSAPLPESQTILSLRTWYFVAITFDGSRISFYLNGKQDGSSTVPGRLCTNDKPLYIGVDFPLTTEYWHGAIDELRIWNSPLSESQIQDVMNGTQAPLESGLVGYWAFDEGSGSIAHDLSGYANDGVLMGNPTWISPGAPIP